MKRILLLLTLLIGFTAAAQTQTKTYRASKVTTQIFDSSVNKFKSAGVEETETTFRITDTTVIVTVPSLQGQMTVTLTDLLSMDSDENENVLMVYLGVTKRSEKIIVGFGFSAKGDLLVITLGDVDGKAILVYGGIVSIKEG